MPDVCANALSRMFQVSNADVQASIIAVALSPLRAGDDRHIPDQAHE
jgi:hypothetical protein